MATTTLELGPPPVTKHLPLALPLWGYGAQFNAGLFTERGQPGGITAAQLRDLTAHVANLRPGHSRIAVETEATPSAHGFEHERKALLRTVELAQAGGANVNLTWWHGPYPKPQRARFMREFADVIEEARKQSDGITHVTIQNEVNGSGVDIGKTGDQKESRRVYKELYGLLDAELRGRRDPHGAATLRDGVRLVGGDLVAAGNSPQNFWLEYMREEMDELLDGYSIHVYWPQGRTAKFEQRLADLVDAIGRFGLVKPIYVTEYGVKAADSGEPGTIGGKNVEDMLETAHQHAWFNALAPQHGCVGFAKWVLYRTQGRTYHDWGMIDTPANQFDRKFTYYVSWLFTHAIDLEWRASGLAGSGNLLASGFSGPNGEHSVFVLNRDDQRHGVRVEGLQTNGSYFAAMWNRNGDGRIHVLPRVAADANGGARVSVAPHGVVVLSTRAFMED